MAGERGERTAAANPFKDAQIPFSVGDPAFTTARAAFLAREPL